MSLYIACNKAKQFGSHKWSNHIFATLGYSFFSISYSGAAILIRGKKGRSRTRPETSLAWGADKEGVPQESRPGFGAPMFSHLTVHPWLEALGCEPASGLPKEINGAAPGW